MVKSAEKDSEFRRIAWENLTQCLSRIGALARFLDVQGTPVTQSAAAILLLEHSAHVALAILTQLKQQSPCGFLG